MPLELETGGSFLLEDGSGRILLEQQVLIDQTLLSMVQSLLAEPMDGGRTWPSGMWSAEEVLDYLNDAQLDLVATTGLILKHGTVACVPHILRHDLPQDLVQIIRLAWIRGTDGRRFPLDRSDIWELDAAQFSGIGNWRTEARIPGLYTTGDLPTRTVQIAPAATVPGSLEILYVSVPAPFSGLGSPPDVPNDASVALTWLTIRQALIKEGRGKDPGRAQLADGIATVATEAIKTMLKGWVE